MSLKYEGGCHKGELTILGKIQVSRSTISCPFLPLSAAPEAASRQQSQSRLFSCPISIMALLGDEC